MRRNRLPLAVVVRLGDADDPRALPIFSRERRRQRVRTGGTRAEELRQRKRETVGVNAVAGIGRMRLVAGENQTALRIAALGIGFHAFRRRHDERRGRDAPRDLDAEIETRNGVVRGDVLHRARRALVAAGEQVL